MIAAVIWVGAVCVTAMLAAQYNRNMGAWIGGSIFFGIFALIAILIAGPKEAESEKPLRMCRHCGYQMREPKLRGGINYCPKCLKQL